MLRSVKIQIVVGTSVIILTILSAAVFFVIDQKTREISLQIFRNAVSFAELTHERIVSNYENNYLQKAFANFDRELASIRSLNEDIEGVALFNYSGETLYIDPHIRDRLMKLTDQDMERIQAIYPSVAMASGRIVYIDKTDAEWRFTNSNGKDVEPVIGTERIESAIYPYQDQGNALRRYSIQYFVTYRALSERIRETRNSILILAGFGILIALFVGGVIAGRITSPIKTLTEGVLKLGAGDLTTRVYVKTQSEIGQLADTFNQMAQDLEKSTQDLVEKEKMGRELELAGEIQRELLPKTLPRLSNLDLAASLVSAEAVGGDCYDFLLLDPDNLIFYVGDVTGHGVPAGLVSAINNALVPAFMQHYKTTQELIVHLNGLLKMKMRPNVFLTMVMAHWHADEARLGFTQAGHDPILHYKVKDGSVDQLSTGGMALGMVPDLSKIVRTDYLAMDPGDVVVLYTDGIPEAWKNETENLGMERFKEIIARNGHLATAQIIHDAIIKEVRDYMGEFPQADDITLMVAKRTV